MLLSFVATHTDTAHMNLPANLFPASLLWGSGLLYVLLLGLAIYLAPWKRFKDKDKLHVFLGSCVLLLLIWSLKAGIRPGLNFHLLGATLFTLMFGWELAFIGLSMVLIGVTLNGASDWTSLPLNALVMGALPVFVSATALRLAVRHLPHHFFVYVLVNGYFCGGLAMILTVLTSSSLMIGLGPYTLDRVMHDYLPFTPFMIFGEGFITGMLATGMALMKPHWLESFDDRRYIAGK